jgi:hypothetical protein
MVDSKRRFDTVWWVYVLLLRTSALHKHRFHTIPKTTLSIGIKFFCLFQRLMSLQHRIWVHRMAPSSAIPWFQYIYMMYVLPFSRQTNISNHFDIYIYVYVYIYIHIYIYVSIYIYRHNVFSTIIPWCHHDVPMKSPCSTVKCEASRIQNVQIRGQWSE